MLAASGGLGGDVAELDIVRERAEEGDSVADKNGIPIDDDALNPTGAEEVLDRDASVDVYVFEAASRKAGNHFCGISRHLFDAASAGGC